MLQAKAAPLKYDDTLESDLAGIASLLKGHYSLSKRALGLLLLQEDRQIERQVRGQEGSRYPAIQGIVAEARASYSQPLSYIIALGRQQKVKRILSATLTSREKPRQRFAENLSRLMMNPVTGIPILLVVLCCSLLWLISICRCLRRPDPGGLH